MMRSKNIKRRNEVLRHWSNGVMEYWINVLPHILTSRFHCKKNSGRRINGLRDCRIAGSAQSRALSYVTPQLHHSITPLLRSVHWRYLAIGILALMGIVVAPAIGVACPGCNAAMDNTVGRGFNLSVLFLMGMPFLLVGSIAIGIVLMRRSLNSTKNKSAELGASRAERRE